MSDSQQTGAGFYREREREFGSSEEFQLIASQLLADGDYTFECGDIIIPFSIKGVNITLDIEQSTGSLDSVHMSGANDLTVGDLKKAGYLSVLIQAGKRDEEGDEFNFYSKAGDMSTYEQIWWRNEQPQVVAETATPTDTVDACGYTIAEEIGMIK